MPDNGGYMMVAYAIVAVVLLGYALKLWKQGNG
jgi:hypothetical protein